MCRSIKTLRPPYAEAVTDADMRAAALQYVRKISGFRAPAAHNAAAFDQAVEEIAARPPACSKRWRYARPRNRGEVVA